jgi:hypothetical protein
MTVLPGHGRQLPKLGKLVMTLKAAVIMILGMGFVRSQNRRRVLSVAVAAAFIHQLGACPCGCLERNLWWQGFLKLTGQSRSDVAPASSDMSQVAIVGSTDCDGEHEHVVYLAGSSAKVAESHLGQFHAFPVVAWHTIMSDQLTLSTTSRYQRNCRALCPSAQTLRAQLQVFLI